MRLWIRLRNSWRRGRCNGKINLTQFTSRLPGCHDLVHRSPWPPFPCPCSPYDVSTMVSSLGTSSPMRQIGMIPPRRQKYRAARAFYLSILVLSIVAAWSIVADRTIGSRKDGGKDILLRFDSSAIHITKKNVVAEDEEVMHT